MVYFIIFVSVLGYSQSKKKLGEISLEGLFSLRELHFVLYSIERCSFKRLSSLRELSLTIESPMNESMTKNIFDDLPNIEKLTLNGKMSNFNLDSLVNLRDLSLAGTINEDFNFDLY